MLSRYHLRLLPICANSVMTLLLKHKSKYKKVNERIQQIFIKQDGSEITNTGQLFNSASTLVGGGAWSFITVSLHEMHVGSFSCLRKPNSIGGVLLEPSDNKLNDVRVTQHKEES